MAQVRLTEGLAKTWTKIDDIVSMRARRPIAAYEGSCEKYCTAIANETTYKIIVATTCAGVPVAGANPKWAVKKRSATLPTHTIEVSVIIASRISINIVHP